MEVLTIPESKPEIIEVDIDFSYRDEYNLAKKVKIEFSDKIPRGNFWGLQRAASWYIDDYMKLVDYHNKVNLLSWLGNHDIAFRMTADFNIFIRKVWNDHHPNKLGNTFVEAIDASLDHNMIVANGIVGIVQQLGLQTTDAFLWVSMGDNQTPERIGQKNLISEEMRVSVQKDGSMAARGSVWNHVGNMGYGVRTDKYYEFGIHNKAEGGRMLSRSVLENGVDQVQNDTFLTPSHSSIFEPQ